MSPIAVTGWNKDLFIEATAVGPPYTNYASELNPGEGKGFYQTGLPTYAWGMPPSGAFVSTIGDNTIFQLQPYTASNALVMSSDTGLTNGTLTLTTPAIYSKIAIMANSASAGATNTGTLALHFSDGSVLNTNFAAPDWFSNTNNVCWFGPARINITSGADDSGLEEPRFYQTTFNIALALGTTNKPLTSLTFGKAGGANSTAIYAISGQPASPSTPIAVTGFNRDVVVESSASGPPYAASASELYPGGGLAFYQSGLHGTTNGLPATGLFQSAVDGSLFQLQPYNGNNALVFSSETGVSQGTLTLTAPAIYNSLSIVANSAGTGAGSTNSGTVTLSFSDGSSLVTNYYAPNWIGNLGFALQGFDDINLTSGATQGAPTDPRFYQTTFDLIAAFGATNKMLTSVTFSQAPGAAATAVYALSGAPGGQTGLFAAPTVADSAAGNILTRSATVGGTVTSTGGDAPEIVVYYGTTDGGNNPAAWAQRSFVGVEPGSFAQSLTGLSPGTKYYFTVAAVNAGGIGWASPSMNFTTAAASFAGVTNLPAANVSSSSAILSGQVLSTGGDAPTITLYYGTSNGGNNPAAWASSINLGTQVGLFAQLVTGLSPSTTYYYTAESVNGAGPAWASPVLSFATPATNPPPPALVSVLTYRNDATREALNTNETFLTPANVNTNTFGKLFSQAVDGYVVAQPLILPGVSVPGKGVHNVVYVATENDSVYAFDADNNSGISGAPLWHDAFANPSAGIYTINATTDLASIAGGFVGSVLGISGTPVIDPTSGTLYVVTITKEVTGSVTNFYNRLHALDVSTGAEKFGGPVLIQGSVRGIGDGNDGNGNVPFVQLKHHQRSSLLLDHGTLYIPFTGHFDYPPYHGWVFSYNPYSLEQTGIWNAQPNGSDGGFWQANCGPAADTAGNIYLESGNGNWDATNNNFGNTVLKLSTTNGLALADWFTPSNQLHLNLEDIDVGSAGQIIVPDSAGSVAHPHLLLAGSKEGTMFLLDRDNMGHFNQASNQVVQTVIGAVGGMWCTPAWFNGTFYYIGSGDHIKAFSLSNAAIGTTPTSQGSTSIGSSSPCVSANGTNNGIVWAMQAVSPPVLYAFNATNVSIQLYNSSQNAARDGLGSPVKFTTPTVANGRVYVGTVNTLTVYGNSAFLETPAIVPNGATFTNLVSVTITDAVPGTTIYYTTDGSTPTTNSILYTGPFVLTKTTGINAVGTMPGSPYSSIASATFISSATEGAGSGLVGQYYTNTLYTDPFVGSPLVRTDAFINFNWNSTPPFPNMSTSDYTVRWTGLVQPLFSEVYTFYTTTDDGTRLWVNGQELVNEWAPQSPTTWLGSISLQANQLYAIEMDYFQQAGGAVAELQWSSPSTTLSVVPPSQLYPYTTVPPVLLSSPATAYFTNGAFSVQLSTVAGMSYVLQGSTDLVHWAALSTNVAPSNLLMILDTSITNVPNRFYRAVEVP